MFDNSISNYDWLCFGLFDSVTIIRCKDCKNRYTNWCPMHWERFEYNEDCEREWIESDNTIDEGFCNFGKSKT